MAVYTITSVARSASEDWRSSKGGEMHVYRLELEGVDDDVQCSRSPKSPLLRAGEEVEGDLRDTDYGLKFTVAAGSGPQREPRRLNAAAALPGGPSQSFPDDRSASIERQTAWKIAAWLAQAQVAAGSLTTTLDVRGLKTLVEDIEQHMHEAGKPRIDTRDFEPADPDDQVPF